MFGAIAGGIASALAGGAMSKLFGGGQKAASGGIQGDVLATDKDRKSGSAGMPRPISYAVFCLKKKKDFLRMTLKDIRPAEDIPALLAARGLIRKSGHQVAGYDR